MSKQIIVEIKSCWDCPNLKFKYCDLLKCRIKDFDKIDIRCPLEDFE